MKETIGFIGVGEFAQHLIRGLMRSDTRHKIVLSPRNEKRSVKLSNDFGLQIASSNEEVVQVSSVVFLSTRPKQAQQALQHLPWTEKHLLISVAAGVSREQLSQFVAPADVCVSMLVNAAAVGASPVSLFPDNQRASSILQSLGKVYAMPDVTAFESVSVFGAVYGWVFALADHLQQWSSDHGIPDTAARCFAVETLQAAMIMASERSEESLANLTNELRTSDGITQHGLENLEESDALIAWRDACTSVLTRLSKPY